jgi:membrane associated rhomboid family serine protease
MLSGSDDWALSWLGLCEGRWWLLITFNIVNAGFWHWALGALGLLVMGRSVELIVGRAHLLCVFLLGTVVGACLHCLASRCGFLPPGQPLRGMLPALFALIGVYSTILPGWRIGAASRWRAARWCATRARAPRARHAAWLAGAGACLWWASGWGPDWGPAAMLPALCAGWAYARTLGFGDRFFLQRVMENGDLLERRMQLMNWEEFLNAELNPVLEKIARHGLRSLNAAERRILRLSRRKLEGW